MYSLKVSFNNFNSLNKFTYKFDKCIDKEAQIVLSTKLQGSHFLNQFSASVNMDDNKKMFNTSIK